MRIRNRARVLAMLNAPREIGAAASYKPRVINICARPEDGRPVKRSNFPFARSAGTDSRIRAADRGYIRVSLSLSLSLSPSRVLSLEFLPVYSRAD